MQQLLEVAQARLNAGEGLRLDVLTIEAQRVSLAVELTQKQLERREQRLYKQERESAHHLTVVLVMAILLVFIVLVLEFRSFLQPLAIVAGAVLALLGTIIALQITGNSVNIISRLGAIIGVGIVAKNGILMLDFVDHLRQRGLSLVEALVHSGRRRLRPVLMTSMAAALGMLPLAYGVGSGADTLKPLAIAVIGALCVSVLLSLVATPTIYYLMLRLAGDRGGTASLESGTAAA